MSRDQLNRFSFDNITGGILWNYLEISIVVSTLTSHAIYPGSIPAREGKGKGRGGGEGDMERGRGEGEGNGEGVDFCLLFSSFYLSFI